MSKAMPLALTGLGLSCPTGAYDFVLLAAVAAGLSQCRPHPAAAMPDAGGQGTSPVLHCPAIAEPLEDGSERMRLLCQQALDRLLDDMPPLVAEERIELVLVLPPEGSGRGDGIDLPEWEHMLAQARDWPAATRFHIIRAGRGALAELGRAWDALEHDTCDRILFGAVDSLLDPANLMGLAGERLLASRARPDGLVPGEGAAFLCLQRPDGAGDVSTLLYPPALAPEPNHGKGAGIRLTGLAKAISGAIRAAGCCPENIRCLAIARDDPLAWSLEWVQARDANWPWRLPEAQRVAVQQGRLESPHMPPPPQHELLDPATVIGHAGVAAPLLAVALAQARLDFAWPEYEAVLVADRPEVAERAALVVGRAGPAAGHEPNLQGGNAP